MEGFSLFITLVGAAAMSGAVMQVVDYFEHPKKSAKKTAFARQIQKRSATGKNL